MTSNKGSKEGVEPQNSGSKVEYVPQKGDIISFCYYLGIVEDLLPEGHFNVRDLCDLAEEKIDEFTADDRPETILLGLSLDRIKEEYISREELRERDEKLIDAISCVIVHSGLNLPEDTMEQIIKIFAEVDSEKKRDK